MHNVCFTIRKYVIRTATCKSRWKASSRARQESIASVLRILKSTGLCSLFKTSTRQYLMRKFCRVFFRHIYIVKTAHICILTCKYLMIKRPCTQTQPITNRKIFLYISLFSKSNTLSPGSGLWHNHNSCFCSSKGTHTGVEPYLFYNLYIFDLFGPPLQLRLPQCVQIVQIQTHETWTRLKEEHFKWYKELLWIPSHLSIFVLIIDNQYRG